MIFGKKCIVLQRETRYFISNSQQNKTMKDLIFLDDVDNTNTLADLFKYMLQKGIIVTPKDIRHVAFRIAHDFFRRGRGRDHSIHQWVAR